MATVNSVKDTGASLFFSGDSGDIWTLVTNNVLRVLDKQDKYSCYLEDKSIVLKRKIKYVDGSNQVMNTLGHIVFESYLGGLEMKIIPERPVSIKTSERKHIYGAVKRYFRNIIED